MISNDMNIMNEQIRQDWFSNQYEKLIGKPFPGKNLTTGEVFKILKDSAGYREINEAKSYKHRVPQAGAAHYVDWTDPPIKKCMCPDEDCTCKGGIVLPKKKIPRGQRYFKSRLCRKVIQRFRKPVPPPQQNFIQRLADMVGVETSVYKDLERKGTLSVRGAELCTARCVRYYVPERLADPKYTPEKQDLSEIKTEVTSLDNDTNEECRKCDGFSCTVATQAIVGPDGKFIIGNFSHVLFGTLNETVMKDIEGTELFISSYKCVNDKSNRAASSLLNFREFITLPDLKKNISSLKRSIYCSIFEIKEPTCTKQPVRASLATQYEVKDTNMISSENICINTPYKGVVIKVKKDPQEFCTSNQTQQEISIQKEQSCNIMPYNLNKQHLNDSQKTGIILEQKLSASKENNEVKDPQQTEINSAQCQINQHFTNISKPELTQVQNEMTAEKFNTDKITTESESPTKQLKTQDQSQTVSTGVNLVSSINDLQDIKYLEDNNLCDTEIKIVTKESLTAPHPNYQKNSNLSYYPILKDSGVIKHHLSKNMFKEHKNIKKPGVKIILISKNIGLTSQENIKHTKYNDSNYFRQKLYRLCSEQLTKIKTVKPFKPIYASKRDSDCNKKESCDDKKLLKSNIDQNNVNILRNGSVNIINDDVYLKPEINIVLSNSKANAEKYFSDREYRPHEDDLLHNLESMAITENKDHNVEQADNNKPYTSIRAKCMSLEQITAIHDKKVTLFDNNIDKYKTFANKYETETQPHNVVKSNLFKSEINSHTSSLYHNNQARNILRNNNILLQDNHEVDNNKLADVSLSTISKIVTGGVKTSSSIRKKISNIMSSQLKKLVLKKANNSVKSLPERALSKGFPKLNYKQRNMSEIDCAKFMKSIQKDTDRCTKTSEKEIFSIQYNSQLMQRNSP